MKLNKKAMTKTRTFTNNTNLFTKTYCIKLLTRFRKWYNTKIKPKSDL